MPSMEAHMQPVWGILDGQTLSLSMVLSTLGAIVPIILVLAFLRAGKNDIPILNPKKPYELTISRAKQEFITGASDMLRRWLKANPDKPVRMNSDFGEVIILPPHMLDEIRNDPRLSFSKWGINAFHGHIPGFDGIQGGGIESGLLQQVVMKDLTKHLNKITEPLAEETSLGASKVFGESPDWHAVPLKDNVLQLVARMSSRVFLGDLLCRDERWLKITTEYTVGMFTGAEKLRLWPAALRPYVHWFLPHCRQLRAQVKEARGLINPVLEQRRQDKARLLTEGKDVTVFNDCLEWFEASSKGETYDAASAQLSMSIVAIHTTTDLLCQCITEIMRHPEIIEPLRKEMKEVLEEHGWKKTALYQMKLLDSVIKESQRTKPLGDLNMRRIATADVTLSDGTFIPKNGTIGMGVHKMWDPEVYENPENWDGYRFMNMRDDPSRQNMAHVVSTGPEHLGFGHGKHACPGRFFAANELKVALIFLLMKYDWRWTEGETPKIRRFGFTMATDPTVKVDIKRRETEVDVQFF